MSVILCVGSIANHIGIGAVGDAWYCALFYDGHDAQIVFVKGWQML